jgi:hypothetical protein
VEVLSFKHWVKNILFFVLFILICAAGAILGSKFNEPNHIYLTGFIFGGFAQILLHLIQY